MPDAVWIVLTGPTGGVDRRGHLAVGGGDAARRDVVVELIRHRVAREARVVEHLPDDDGHLIAPRRDRDLVGGARVAVARHRHLLLEHDAQLVAQPVEPLVLEQPAAPHAHEGEACVACHREHRTQPSLLAHATPVPYKWWRWCVEVDVEVYWRWRCRLGLEGVEVERKGVVKEGVGGGGV